MIHPLPHPIGEGNNTVVVVDGIEVGPFYRFSKGKRMTKRQRYFAIHCLLKRDGDECLICKSKLQDPFKADVDHVIPKEPPDHRFFNLRLTCHSCNSRESFRQKLMATATASSTLREREKRGVGEGAASKFNNQRPPSLGVEETATVIHWKNERNEPLFRRRVFELVLERKIGNYYSAAHLRKIARNSCGCSNNSAYSYMERLVMPNDLNNNNNNGGSVGPPKSYEVFPLIEEEDITSKVKFCRFTDEKLYNLTVEQIEMRFPLNGQSSVSKD